MKKLLPGYIFMIYW